MSFHAETNSKKKIKNKIVFQRIKFQGALQREQIQGPGAPSSRPHIVHMKYHKVCGFLRLLFKSAPRALKF